MQDICKIEQATSPPSLPSPITPKTLIDLKQIILKLLFQGQESAQIIRTFLNQRLGLKDEDHVSQVDLDHHSLVTLNSLENALSILQSYDFDHDDSIRSKRKLDRTDINESLDHCKGENTCTGTVSKERRGCYKRRKNGPTKTIETLELIDDGHAWRKYGQKDILNTKYPRNYYRCTHKFDQECQALKQVQQISENPIKYKIIYNGEHTCKNLNKTSSIITDPEDNNSSILLSFETHQNYPTVKNNNSSSFYPSPIFHNNNNNHAMVKQEHNSINQELPISPSEPHDHHHHHHGAHSTLQYSSCSDNIPSSSDLTTSTPVSDQADSYDYGNLDEELMMISLCMDYHHHHVHLDDIMKFSNTPSVSLDVKH